MNCDNLLLDSQYKKDVNSYINNLKYEEDGGRNKI